MDFAAAFLGLLHLEIIQERLEREYDLDLITTAPGVRYKITLTSGNVIEVDNPSRWPDPSEIETIEEPVIIAKILTNEEYVGGFSSWWKTSADGRRTWSTSAIRA